MQIQTANEILETVLHGLLDDISSYLSLESINSKNNEILIKTKVVLPKSKISELKDVFNRKLGSSVTIETVTNRLLTQGEVKPIDSIKNIIGVGSAKGGVGKSTTTLNLAKSFASSGFKVAILDADIYGPSMPIMMGLENQGNKPDVDDSGLMIPQEKYGIKMISMGHLVDESTPVVWRGPMVSNALMQLLEKTSWGEIDYLFIDLPPGTGDILLSLCQKIPLSGVALVTTPEPVAWRDTLKSASMFKKLNVDIAGIIENMSKFHCPNCDHEISLFGSGGADILSELFDVPVLGKVEYDKNIVESHISDTQDFASAALSLSMQLASKSLSKSVPFPKIKIT